MNQDFVFSFMILFASTLVLMIAIYYFIMYKRNLSKKLEEINN